MIQSADKIKASVEARLDKPGVIEASAFYTLDEFTGRTRMTKSAMRSARRKGLKVRRIGKRAFILGKDAIEFIEAAAV